MARPTVLPNGEPVTFCGECSDCGLDLWTGDRAGVPHGDDVICEPCALRDDPDATVGVLTRLPLAAPEVR